MTTLYAHARLCEACGRPDADWPTGMAATERVHVLAPGPDTRPMPTNAYLHTCPECVDWHLVMENVRVSPSIFDAVTWHFVNNDPR